MRQNHAAACLLSTPYARRSTLSNEHPRFDAARCLLLDTGGERVQGPLCLSYVYRGSQLKEKVQSMGETKCSKLEKTEIRKKEKKCLGISLKSKGNLQDCVNEN